jgi:hypothetical protein
MARSSVKCVAVVSFDNSDTFTRRSSIAMRQAFAATMLDGRTLTFSSLYRPMMGHLAAPQLQ